MRLLSVDPGSTHSAFVLIEDDYKPQDFGKIANDDMLKVVNLSVDHVVIEMIGHYGTGMPAGQTVFDTCIWIGRFWQAAYAPVSWVKRATVKAHLCGSAKAKDGNVRQAMIDRFTPGQPNAGKGYKNMPGWFYGFHSDIWAAYSVAVYYMDTRIKATT